MEDRDWQAIFLASEYWLADECVRLKPCSISDLSIVYRKLTDITQIISKITGELGLPFFLFTLFTALHRSTPHLLVAAEVFTNINKKHLLKLPFEDFVYLLDEALRLNAESKKMFSSQTEDAKPQHDGGIGMVFDLLISRGYSLAEIKGCSLAEISVYLRESVIGKQHDFYDLTLTTWKGNHYDSKAIKKEAKNREDVRRSVLSKSSGAKADPKFVNDEWRRLRNMMTRVH